MVQFPSKGIATYPFEGIPDHVFSLRFLQNRRSANAPQTCFLDTNVSGLPERGIGGAERNRTADPLLAKQVLYQLSYSPKTFQESPPKMVGLGRLELPTSRLSSARSNQLSYKPQTLLPMEGSGTCSRATGSRQCIAQR